MGKSKELVFIFFRFDEEYKFGYIRGLMKFKYKVYKVIIFGYIIISSFKVKR